MHDLQNVLLLKEIHPMIMGAVNAYEFQGMVHAYDDRLTQETQLIWDRHFRNYPVQFYAGNPLDTRNGEYRNVLITALYYRGIEPFTHAFASYLRDADLCGDDYKLIFLPANEADAKGMERDGYIRRNYHDYLTAHFGDNMSYVDHLFEDHEEEWLKGKTLDIVGSWIKFKNPEDAAEYKLRF